MPFKLAMYPRTCLLTGCRRAALVCVWVALLLLPASAAEAQRLLTLVSGVGQAASAGDLGPSVGPAPTAVQVDLELLRAAPARLEVPTPDGSVLSAQRSVFEDRGGGDLMWSGGQPGAGYDTVVLTVEGGRLVGRFGAAVGGVYQIHAERDGRGGMTPLVGPGLEEWCGVEAGAEDGHDAHAHVAAEALAADPPRRVSNPQSHDRLDILVAYTATAAENWADRGGARAAIRHAGDYLKMVFRNNDLPVEPHIVHIAQASGALDRVGRDWGWHGYDPDESDPLGSQLIWDGELLRLRHEHRADLVHLFTGEHPALRVRGFGAICGLHRQLTKGLTAFNFSPAAYGWTVNYPSSCGDYAVTFAHEIGHGLGAHHDPANVRRPERLFRPYAIGHANFDVMPSIGTAMSYRGQIEPFFSTPRIRPYGAVVGVAEEQDNERTLRETVHIGVQYSDYLRSLEGVPAQPSDLRVRLDGGAARLSWRDNAPGADGYEVEYVWWYSPGRPAWRLQAVEGRSGATLPLESTEPGARHSFVVRATKGEVRSLRSSEVTLVVPGEPVEAPSDVVVTVVPGLDIAEVRWTDNSDGEVGFDVQLLQGGEPVARQRAQADSERAEFHALHIRPQFGAEYGVRVFAYNWSGYSESSEVATFRWAHPLAQGPATDVSVSAIGPTTVRLSWTGPPEGGVYTLEARLAGWRHQVSRRSPPSAGAAWMDFEALARGGRYTFEVRPYFGDSWRVAASRAYLTLGERGAGPRAPSDLSLVVTDDGLIRLSWKDNSSDELGFEIQTSSTEGTSWRRLLAVPAGTESVAHDYPYSLAETRFRAFAYNERGYSAGSELKEPPALAGSCRADAETLCLQDSRFEVKMNWWKADGESGVGRVVEEGTDDSGMFQFFDPENWEVLIKVLDGCRTNGRMWVLGASTTDLGYRIRVTDTITEESRSYTNEPGRPAPAIVDTEAFSQPCRGGAGP